MKKIGYTPKKSAEYTVSYSNMRGVDFSASESSRKSRFAYLENMYRDYDSDGGNALESFPGFRRIRSTQGKVNKLYHQKTDTGKDYIVVHSSDKLYRFDLDDKINVPLTSLMPIKDVKSSAFSSGSDLYVLDGESISIIHADGSYGKVGDEENPPYVPTTYVNGVEYKQRNLLTDEFIEEFTVRSADDVSYGTTELQYRITDEDRRLCAVSGIADQFNLGTVYIPSYIDIANKRYKVTEIADGAFASMNTVNEVRICDGIIRISSSAFKGCMNLQKVSTPNSILEIGTEAFAECARLNYFYLGTSMKVFGANVFKGSENLKDIRYGSSASSFDLIANNAVIESRTVTAIKKDTSITVKIPLYTPTSSIIKVTANGSNVSFRHINENGEMVGILISETSKSRIEGKTFKIHASANRTKCEERAKMPILQSGSFKGSGMEAILGCTLAANYDGRVFLTGNPRLPNTVIYSERDDTGKTNPLYFGVYNFFNDGIGAFPVISMLPVGDSLAIFKKDDDGCGSIFYHKPSETGSDVISRVYPVTYIHNGVRSLGDTISFLDEPIFISSDGVCSLTKERLNLERMVSCRSHNVNAKLLCENLSEVSLAKWRGYLVVCAGEHFYLADSRSTFTHETGNLEYEWYYLNGMGVYTAYRPVFKYSFTAPPGYEVKKDFVDRKCPSELSVLYDEANDTHYVTEDGKKYSVYITEEHFSGSFNPATAVLSVNDEILLFGTENGSICIINSDMRGIAPRRLSEIPGFDPKEYALVYGRRIHPDFYDYDARPVTYAVKTGADNCGFSYLFKDTVKNSLVIKCRCWGSEGGFLSCEVGSDKNGYRECLNLPMGSLDFSDINFLGMSLASSEDMNIVVSEKEKNWVEKEIHLSTSDFRAPISLHSITYRFRIKGRIKN